MVDITPENTARMLDGVTEGPWKPTWIAQETSDWCIHAHGSPWQLAYLADGGLRTGFNTEANARFIAWAREAVPALAAENAALKADVRTYQDTVRDMTAEAEAMKARLAEVEAQLNAVQRAHVIRVEACIAEEDRAEAAEARVAELETVQGAAGVRQAAAVLLGAHQEAIAIPVQKRTAMQQVLANMGRNRLTALATPTTGETP
jgi:chromosome segregation ATPase